MFSGFAVYLRDLLVCMLRDSPKSPRDNGVWLVLSDTTDPKDPGLRGEFPSLRSIDLLGGKIGHWLLIPTDGTDFESEALHACELMLGHDSRLGRIPASRRSNPGSAAPKKRAFTRSQRSPPSNLLRRS
jgi:hypothetical protein